METTTKKLNKVQEELIYALKNNQTIVDVARNLNTTVSDISRLVGSISDQHDGMADIFEKKRWPRDVNSGYIFIGGGATLTPAERNGKLIPGMHVFADKIPRRNKGQKNDYYMIYLSCPVVERQFMLFKIKQNPKNSKFYKSPIRSRKNGIIKSLWLVEQIDHADLKKELLTQKILLQSSENTRFKYLKGEWAGQVNSRSILNVKYDWT